MMYLPTAEVPTCTSTFFLHIRPPIQVTGQTHDISGKSARPPKNAAAVLDTNEAYAQPSGILDTLPAWPKWPGDTLHSTVFQLRTV